MTTSKKLGLFSLTMINVIAVASLRSLPVSAEYGFSLVFYYLLAAIIFFIPISVVCAELASGWPNRGGIYVWVREAFGEKWGFLIIWLQWLYNIVWYPTILTFVAETLLSVFFPEYQTKTVTLCTVLGLFWGCTLLNWFGMRLSSLISTITALFGTLLPMLLIMVLAFTWVNSGHSPVIDLNWHTFLPNKAHLSEVGFFAAILFGLIGMEMSATHADEVDNPGRTFPKAIRYSTLLIFIALMGGSLAIAVVVPKDTLNVVTGLTQAFGTFFTRYGLGWMEPIMGALIVIGGIGNVAAWIIGPTKGLWAAAKDGNAPNILSKTNNQQVPTTLLLLQALIFTILCSVFILMPTVESAYWVLTAITAQMSLLVYIGMFLAVIALRQKQPNRARAYRIPGGHFGLMTICGIGITTCMAAIIFGFIPPTVMHIENTQRFEALLIAGMLMTMLPPFLMYKKK